MMNLAAQRKLLGSPIFQRKLSALAAGARTVLDFAGNATAEQKYAPFNALVINNTSNENVTVYINQSSDSAIFVPSNTAITADSTSVPAVWSVAIENNGTSSTNANEIIVSVQKSVVSGQDVLSSAVRRFIGGNSI